MGDRSAPGALRRLVGGRVFDRGSRGVRIRLGCSARSPRGQKEAVSGHPLVLHQKGDVVEVARREPGAHVRAEDEPIALVDGAYTWRVSQSHEWVGHIYLKLDANAGGARTRGGYAGVVGGVRHHDVALPVHRHRARLVELRLLIGLRVVEAERAGGPRQRGHHPLRRGGRKERSEHTNKYDGLVQQDALLYLRRDQADAVIGRVRHQHVAVAIHRHPGGGVELRRRPLPVAVPRYPRPRQCGHHPLRRVQITN
eukprot:1196384-Prorocentrum_minimum.AAC.4